MRYVCLALILIQNLHAISADSIFHSLAASVTAAVSRIYPSSNKIILPNERNDTNYGITPVSFLFLQGFLRTFFVINYR